MHDINNVKGLQDHKVQRFIFSDEEILRDFLSSILPLVGYYKEITKISLEVEKLETPISVFGKECMLDIWSIVNDEIIVLLKLYKDIIAINIITKTNYLEPMIINGYETHHEYEDISFKKIFGIEKLKTYTFRIDNLSDIKYTVAMSDKAKMWLEMYRLNSIKEIELMITLTHKKGYGIMEKSLRKIEGFWEDPFFVGAKSNEQREMEKYME